MSDYISSSSLVKSNRSSIDSKDINSHNIISAYLEALTSKFHNNCIFIFLCIGSDRSTGDSLGPLTGFMLKEIHKISSPIFGTLDSPVHAKNLSMTLDYINTTYKNSCIIAIDACLSSSDKLEFIFIEEGPLSPGAAFNKKLPSAGDISITAAVNTTGFNDFIILQNTRLNSVFTLAETISKSINLFLNNFQNKAE